ncbi:MAG: fructose-6-phosphate aldolase [archaeon]
MKIFLDTANIDQIREMAALGMVDGVTTNPTLIAKEGVNYKKRLAEIAKVVKGPISAEAVSEKAEGMVKEGIEYSKIAKNIIIKITMTEEGMKAVRVLEKRGIRTNVTLVFTPNQALVAAKAGASYVSPFVGRLDDRGEDGMKVVEDIMEILGNYRFKTQVIVASVRNAEHMVRAGRCGAPIATVPYQILKEMFRHELTDAGIKKFLEDWEKVKNK